MKQIPLRVRIKREAVSQVIEIPKMYFGGDTTWFVRNPAGKLCDEAIKYRAKISFQKGNATTNAKSLLSVLAASVKYNDEVEIVCEGEDEKEALEGVVALIQSGLGE